MGKSLDIFHSIRDLFYVTNRISHLTSHISVNLTSFINHYPLYSSDPTMSDDAGFFKTTSTRTTVPANSSGQQPHIMNGAGQPAEGRITSESVGERKKLTQKEADALYSERMEDEYAKREGGA